MSYAVSNGGRGVIGSFHHRWVSGERLVSWWDGPSATVNRQSMHKMKEAGRRNTAAYSHFTCGKVIIVNKTELKSVWKNISANWNRNGGLRKRFLRKESSSRNKRAPSGNLLTPNWIKNKIRKMKYKIKIIQNNKTWKCCEFVHCVHATALCSAGRRYWSEIDLFKKWMSERPQRGPLPLSTDVRHICYSNTHGGWRLAVRD